MPKVFTQVHAAVAALIEKDGKVLLIQEDRPSKPWHGQWMVPAGWVDLGENPLEAIVREVEEEAGGQFSPTNILGLYDLARHDQPMPDGGFMHGVKIVFLGDFQPPPQPGIAQDSSAVSYFTPAEIEAMDAKTLRDVDIKIMVREYFAGVRFPLSILHHTVVEK